MTEFNARYLEFCTPFINAIKEIYSTMLGSDITPGKPEIKKTPRSLGIYSAIMGINGYYDNGEERRQFKGSLVLSWPKSTYLKSASAMLMEEFSELSEEIADVGMEICNMTMGNAKKVLAQKGYNIEMSIPTCVKGKDHEISVQEGVITIATPLVSKHGGFSVELNYQDQSEF